MPSRHASMHFNTTEPFPDNVIDPHVRDWADENLVMTALAATYGAPAYVEGPEDPGGSYSMRVPIEAGGEVSVWLPDMAGEPFQAQYVPGDDGWPTAFDRLPAMIAGDVIAQLRRFIDGL